MATRPKRTGAPKRASRLRSPRPPSALPTLQDPSFKAPDFTASRRLRMGSSYLEQFVSGHNASDILRELVQNEFDGGGHTLSITFGSGELEIAGTGNDITPDGWERLSVIVGTGPVVGARDEIVAEKTNGIGSKNFGLRSLFRFGDQIYVRSGGRVGLLDLLTQETGNEQDDHWAGEKGVRVSVPYRQQTVSKLEAFDIDRESHALDLMAEGIPDTLVKLALQGRSKGIREVIVRSLRTGRSLDWRQTSKSERIKVPGVDLTLRSGRLTDSTGDPQTFQEAEFSRSFDVPEEHLGRKFPAYYDAGDGRFRIAVSLPLVKLRVDARAAGHLYYPLKTPDSLTGCAVSVSAPFELNNDRSGITDHTWNEWLIDRAADLTLQLLIDDWFERYGADAFKGLATEGPTPNSRFTARIAKGLSELHCWPTRAKGRDRFRTAAGLVVPAAPALDGLLEDKCYLDAKLARDEEVLRLAGTAGAKTFTLSSLVRLRCAGRDASHLKTELEAHEASIYYEDYDAALSDVQFQTKLAAALSPFSRRLTKANKADLRETASTLNATSELRPAKDLRIVGDDIWKVCHEPLENRLHRALVPFKVISTYSDPFDEEQWLVDAAKRAASAPDPDRERDALYKRLLTWTGPLPQPVYRALRNNPVLRNQRGEWVAPSAMVILKKPVGQLLDPFVDAPAKQVLSAGKLVAQLKIRDRLNGSDLVRLAEGLAERPDLSERFERLLSDNLKLLTPPVVAALREIPCLKAKSGKLALPSKLHRDTPANRLCIEDEDLIVARNAELLHRRLKLHDQPSLATLLGIIEAHREAGDAPPNPATLYPALVAAAARSRKAEADLSGDPICWVRDAYHSPEDVLVGTAYPSVLDQAIPCHRFTDAVGLAYVALGARQQAGEDHWVRFFQHVDAEWPSPVSDRQRRLLFDAYESRYVLPAGMEDAACLVDSRNRLYSLNELRRGRIVEPDFPELQSALEAADSPIGVIGKSDRTRRFFTALGIMPLSSIAIPGALTFGGPANPKLWYKPKHSARFLNLFHWPIFARAVWEIAERHRSASFLPIDLADVRQSLALIDEISFFKSIRRRYSVDAVTVEVSAHAALDGSRIGLVPPKNLQEFHFLLADVLAEMTGATTAAVIRSVSSSLLPMLLMCTTPEDMRDYLARIGIHGFDAASGEDEEDLHADLFDEPEELAREQVFDSLNTQGSPDLQEPITPDPDAVDRIANPSIEPPPPPPSPPLPPPTLPALDAVKLDVTDPAGTLIEVKRRPSGGRGGWGYSLPMTPAEQEHARALGQRGEALVYREELERVRAMGFEHPEQYVTWTSQDNPLADHDILSINRDRQPKWIEVKSTAGADGHFDWSRNEFEKALAVRDRYELWRVYRVDSTNPVAKCFVDPTRLIGARRIVLELGILRANIEGAG